MAGKIFSGTYTSGVVLNNPATQNPATVAATGYLYDYGGAALMGSAGTSWTVTNLGRVVGKGLYGVGVDLASGGTLSNGQSGSTAGLILGATVGVTLGGPGLVTNFGTITGGIGVELAAGGTLVDAGAISSSSGTAVSFAAGAGDLLVVDPGAAFAGTVSLGGGAIELAAGTRAGTLGGFGTSLTGFATVKIDAGAAWQASGTIPTLTNDGTLIAGGTLTLGTVGADGSSTGVIALAAATTSQLVELSGPVAAGQTVLFAGHPGAVKLDNPGAFAGAVIGFQAGDTLDVAGVVATGYSYAGGILTLTNRGTAVAQLKLATPYAKAAFALGADGSGGTDVTVTPTNPPNIFSGLYPNGIVLSNPSTQNPATVTATGFVSNSSSAGIGVLGQAGFAWTLDNYGTITGGTPGTAIAFGGGGSISNAAGGLIAVQSGIGIVISGGAGSIANAGTIQGGISLAGGGTVTNAARALLQGASGGTALTISGGQGGLANLGNIAGPVTLAAGGSVTNGASTTTGATLNEVYITGTGAVTNFGTFLAGGPSQGSGGPPAISISGAGAVTNSGTIIGSSSVSMPPSPVIVISAPAMVFNSGKIMTGTAGDDALVLASGLVNNSGAILGAVSFSGPGPGTVVNTGSILTGGTAIAFSGAGTVTNGQSGASGGLISGADGIIVSGAATVTNFGAITAIAAPGATGVLFASGGTLANFGTIDATIGVSVGGPAAVVNAGSIIGHGGTAIAFGAGDDLLVVDPGAVFGGAVNGGGGSNTLELASAAAAGTLTGLGTNFSNFTKAKVDPGADWLLAGTAPAVSNDGTVVVGGALVLGSVGEDAGNSGLIEIGGNASAEFAGAVATAQTVAFGAASGQVKLDQPGGFAGAITGFQAGDTLDVAGIVATTYRYAAGVLTLLDGTTPVAQLRLATAQPGVFLLASDGSGGTLVTLAGHPANVFSGTYTNGIVLSNPAQNQAQITPTAVVSNAGGTAVYGSAGTAWTLTNQGTISGSTGIALASGGIVRNAGPITGVDFGIDIGGGSGTVFTMGTVSATGSDGVGIQLSEGGSLSAGEGTISGVAAGVVADASAIIDNEGGVIIAAGSTYSFGVYLAGGGLLFNDGGIAGDDAGVVFNGAGTLNNAHGKISGTGSNGIGVYLGASGITLGNDGQITGRYGIIAGAGDTAGDTIINAGTVTGTGGNAVVLGSGGDRLVVDPGAVFVGYVLAGGSDVIELAAGSGTVDGLGSRFAGFATVVVDTGASWQISGGGSKFVNDGTVGVDGSLSFGAVTHDKGRHGVIDLGNGGTAEFTAAAGKGETLVFTDNTGTLLLDSPLRFRAAISGFTQGDVIDLVGLQANALAFANHQLIVSENGNPVASLTFGGHFTANEFALSPDGSGGTDITLLGPTAASFWTMHG